MNTFEYLAVLFSIIVGLALTEMLQGVRDLVTALRQTLPGDQEAVRFCTAYYLICG